MTKYRNHIVFLVVVAGFLTPVSGGQDQGERMKEVQARLSSITPPETAFDSITFTLTGSDVTLQGFTNRPARAKDSERAVRSLSWVGEVVNEIEVTSLVGTDSDIRLEALSILVGLVPRAFPQPWPRIRIKVHYGDVALYGSAQSNEEFRLKAAIAQIQALPHVRSIANHVTVG